MIITFLSEATRDIYDGLESKQARRIPQTIWRVAQRKLDLLNAAHSLIDLKSPPANRLEGLKGDLKGKYSIRINDQCRIIFEFRDGNAYEVEIVDYH
ncbi:MAG: type II toxin-antitoxin system RelE/ParE family toxin [Candidatus Omnitrophica bacterium]|nr:type II toxin-antitoxin system RelE/ParE family toxin [Candidatus Omnitrophota bacterium]MDE2010106.1 type II toxin-antitoxin system RelE/ParE family toxin [Candidatus Omnitrophota bacterium]MDE2232263.1 type II toxin-antitoxin system RelE/ParE family toxin [Candidatus Omnitrophota bacterium]